MLLLKEISSNESGQGMVEYGLILALVSVVSLGALGGIGSSVSENFNKVKDAVGGAASDAGKSIYTQKEIDKKVTDEGFIPIASAGDLDKLRNNTKQTFGVGTKWEKEYTSGLDKKYIQVKDIDLSGIDNFDPIGHSVTVSSFSGTFDGGGYEISNLKVDRGSRNHAALFGRTAGAEIKHVGVVNANVKGGTYVGVLIGSHNDGSTITHSYAIGDVSGTGSQVGGLVGGNYTSSFITKSYALGNVLGSGNSIGSLVGGNQGGGSITDSGWANVDGIDGIGYRSTGTINDVIGQSKEEIEVIIKNLNN